MILIKILDVSVDFLKFLVWLVKLYKSPFKGTLGHYREESRELRNRGAGARTLSKEEANDNILLIVKN